MFDLFKQKKEERPGDVKGIRDSLLLFIKEQLQKAEGGEGGMIRGIQLYLTPSAEEKHLYEAAIYVEEEGRFREEVQKIGDDYAIDLPEGWNMEVEFVEAAPPDAVKAKDIEAALFFSTRKQPSIKALTTAFIRILNGAAEKDVYTITSTGGKVCIGRERKVQGADGFYRINTIAFPPGSHDANKYISRQHAHIEWSDEAGGFLLYADEGGVPPRNKVKVRSEEGTPVKLQASNIGHYLQEGDQIILGESALLEFSYKQETSE
jgi:hypothetical protein